MELFVTTLNGEAHSLLHVQPETTVRALKRLIYKVLDVPVAKQRLSSDNGQQKITLSDDSKLLSFYGLRSGSKVCVLIIAQLAPFQVFLKNLQRNEMGQTSTYDVAPDETVSQFKAKVQRKEGVRVNHQRLIYAGKHLDDDGQTLENYGIKEGCTIHLLFRLKGGRHIQ